MDFKTIISRVLRGIGKSLPAKKREAERVKSGSDFNKSNSLVLLCKDTDEQKLKERKSFLRHLKGEYGLRNVLIYCFSESEETDLPVYLSHLKELDFICLSDLSWRLVPKKAISGFCEKNFDLLIDLNSEPSEPLEHIIASSKAKMKIGRRGSVHEKYLDLIIDIPEDNSEKQFLKETEYFLSKFSFK